MGLLSSAVSITRYKVNGKLNKPAIETVYNGLKRAVIKDIDKEPLEITSGWTSFDNPYSPSFEGSSFVIGTLFIFSLRIDKKAIPAKVVKKYCTLEIDKKLAESGREFLSRNEKKSIKENVISMLCRQIPATPNIIDLVWNYEESSLWFFSNAKAANEELETLFSKSFQISLLRLFPYTAADAAADLSDAQRDKMARLSPTKFSE